ncbi:MAG: hypothetical protein B7Y41_11520 [Hydrogenophilales bacterium 28-61-23]|nr:MAG: hypothetical protein B7Y41_11520 [Hydrogenophilales bacterium 28-61-23]
MKLPHPKLRLPMALLLASFVLGGSLFHISLNHRLASEKRLIAEKSQAELAARAVREAPARLIQNRAEAPLFQRIEHSGFIGAEDRIDWISALAKTRAKLNLASLSWRMAPQTESPLAPDLHVSNMELSANPVDADTLTELLRQLQLSAHGRFTVEQCNLSFDADGLSGQANCRLNWWTLAQTDG